MERISILIVTKNRSTLLERCFQSLVVQREKPYEIVLVDNDSTDATKFLTETFAKRLPIHYWYTTVQGYPKGYNFGIKKCKGDRIVFLDDDCVVTRDWFDKLKQSIKKNPTAVIQGKTLSVSTGNIYADIMGDHYQNWVTSNMVAYNLLRTFDNKNLCVPKVFIKKFGVFNESFAMGSEDIELGIRYFRNGVKIVYDPSIIAFHRERDTFNGFISQHVRIAKSEAIVDQTLFREEKTASVYPKKIFLHTRSVVRRELHYLRAKKIGYVFLLPFLYTILAGIRLWTYYTTAWSIQK